MDMKSTTFLSRELVWEKFGGHLAFMSAHEDYNDAFWDNLTVE